jgi:dihydrofolate reductase
MAKLIYSAIASVDGYVADEEGKFDWAEPGQEVHAFINDLERSVGTYLYGRRMYETMEEREALVARSRAAGVPVEHVLPTHGAPTDRAALERALS